MQLEFWLKVARFFSLEKLTSKQTKTRGLFYRMENILGLVQFNHFLSLGGSRISTSLKKGVPLVYLEKL